ncbi:S-adenosyl-L-methionine-dependent methyltransferase [Apiospora marii]|uniref:S-adenosyl-L-methionine-dependent methyltransferase n=1 Tax=Apiospora marii TaxID=335849 RepID=A0ABR1SAP6_9PEZI
METELEAILSTVVQKTTSLTAGLKAEDMIQPTFDAAGYGAYKGESTLLRQTRYELTEAARDLLRLAQGPEDEILQMALCSADTSNLATVLRFDIATSIPIEGPIEAEVLADKVGLPLTVLLRIVRYAIGNGLFIEPAPEVFAHSAASACLAQSQDLSAVGRMTTGWGAKNMLCIPKWLKQQQQQGDAGPQAPFNVAFPEYENVFEQMDKDPAVAKDYHAYMTGRAVLYRYSHANLTGAWDWSTVGAKTVVDVGGSAGHSCLALADACLEAKFIVQDVNTVALEQGRQAMQSLPPTVTERVTFEQYDFFTPQKTVGDIYIFRHILHDWSDENSVQIVKSLVPALRSGATVLVCEGIMPEPPAKKANTWDRKQFLFEDMAMMCSHNARERTVEHFVRLFKEADCRFEYMRTTGGQNGAFLSVVEFRFNVD